MQPEIQDQNEYMVNFQILRGGVGRERDAPRDAPGDALLSQYLLT